MYAAFLAALIALFGATAPTRPAPFINTQSGLRLDILSGDEIERLGKGPRCTFYQEKSVRRETWFIATKRQALIRADGKLRSRPLTAEAANRLRNGGTITMDGYRITVTLGSIQPAPSETSAHHATLRVSRGKGRATLSGTWDCIG